ncbi:Coatomer subunit beta [Nosema bombycis CQ1]|uniref:Coatomer subunit beta n=1 Tax=Nosema bombycis (strain CQ1 / CVCC 102059) TaxID=578461 RepID=R0MKS5_NOSB1|nr:Coatomer subunit beta [Nosema bombycis CQ1]|eukprot:EOB14835.1 Coatomer subunit beta [Nosema bombycis CQ1]
MGMIRIEIKIIILFYAKKSLYCVYAKIKFVCFLFMQPLNKKTPAFVTTLTYPPFLPHSSILLHLNLRSFNPQKMKLEKSNTKKFRSSRVKALEIHSIKNIVVCGLYNGYIQTWDLSNPKMINESHVSEFPIRTIKIVENNDCVLVGTDEGKIHVYDLVNLRRIQSFDAHFDFIRKIELHPSQEEFLTCSDDGSIKRWRLGKDIRNLGTYSGHGHFVMDVKFYPKDTRRFISCSLDGTIKMWDVSQTKPIKTYKGHINGINSICFIPNEEYFVSASDDLSIKVWELNSSNCISTLTGHSDNINSLYAHKNRIISTSEDGSVRFWDCKSFQLKDTLTFNSGRVWDIKIKGSTFVIGTDENLIFLETKSGSILTTLKNKKVFYVLQNQVFTCKLDEEEGERTLFNTKMLSELDYHPSELVVSENGKSIALVNEGIFTLYSSLGFRKKFSGQGSSLCFISNSEFVVLDGDFLIFYDKNEIVMRLQVEGLIKVVYLRGVLVGIFESSMTFYTKNGKSLGGFEGKFKGIVANTKDDFDDGSEQNDNDKDSDDQNDLNNYYVGIKNNSLVVLKGLNLIQEFHFTIESYTIYENLFVFSSEGKFYYLLVGPSPYVNLIASSYGLISGLENGDLFYVEDSKVKALPLDTEFIKFQNQSLADSNTEIPENASDSFRLKAISFYESLGLHDKALEICTNDNHKFEILLKLSRLDEAFEIADSPLKFNRLGRLFMKENQINLNKATECFYKGKDYQSLLFVDLLSKKKVP